MPDPTGVTLQARGDQDGDGAQSQIWIQCVLGPPCSCGQVQAIDELE